MSLDRSTGSMSRIEERFRLEEVAVEEDKIILDGKYPLQPFRKGARGTYGGELICQALYAGWATVEDEGLTPHSLHSYFVKAGSDKTVMRWEVQQVSNTKNYANRLVQGFQGPGGRLVFVLQVSFTRTNEHAKRVESAEKAATKALEAGGVPRPTPIRFQAAPNDFFYKYRNKLDELHFYEHTHGLLHHIIPPDYSRVDQKIDFSTSGDKEFGIYFRVNDDWRSAENPLKSKILALSYASDSAYLSTVIGAIGLRVPISPAEPDAKEALSFFRVSLDHNVYFHDMDFDTTDWLYLDYRFTNYTNDRVLCQCEVYTLDGRMVASVIQEGLIYFNDHIVSRLENLGVDGSDSGPKL